MHVLAGRKRKRCDSESDAAEDEDFVPGVEENEEEVEETEDEEYDSDLNSYLRMGQRSSAGFHVHKSTVSSSLKLLSDMHWIPEPPYTFQLR